MKNNINTIYVWQGVHTGLPARTPTFTSPHWKCRPHSKWYQYERISKSVNIELTFLEIAHCFPDMWNVQQIEQNPDLNNAGFGGRLPPS